MNKKIKTINKKDDLSNNIDSDIVFLKIQRDTIGKSSSNPTWGEVYKNSDGKLQYIGVGLYKEEDYDMLDAPYAEKAWSILGKRILKDARVPKIDVVEENGADGIISYRLLDNDGEDLMHIRDLMFHKFEREELRTKKDLFNIKDILECVRIQIEDDDNYRKVEKSIIHTLLMDAITNNGDRHAHNWALVVNKKTNEYDLAVFDHSSAFIDLFNEKSRFTSKGWVGGYTITDERERWKRYWNSWKYYDKIYCRKL